MAIFNSYVKLPGRVSPKIIPTAAGQPHGSPPSLGLLLLLLLRALPEATLEAAPWGSETPCTAQRPSSRREWLQWRDGCRSHRSAILTFFWWRLLTGAFYAKREFSGMILIIPGIPSNPSIQIFRFHDVPCPGKKHPNSGDSVVGRSQHDLCIAPENIWKHPSNKLKGISFSFGNPGPWVFDLLIYHRLDCSNGKPSTSWKIKPLRRDVLEQKKQSSTKYAPKLTLQ